MNKPTFTNWHLPKMWYRAKEYNLKFLMPHKTSNNRLEFTATDEYGKQMTITLDEELTKLFLMHLDKSWYGKEVTREMYGLPKI